MFEAGCGDDDDEKAPRFVASMDDGYELVRVAIPLLIWCTGVVGEL